MPICSIKMQLKCDDSHFQYWARKTMLQLYKSFFGIQRFLMLDWWKVKLSWTREPKTN